MENALKGPKGDAKQQEWLDKIMKTMKESVLSPSATKIWKTLENGGFENIPRKKAKYVYCTRFYRKLSIACNVSRLTAERISNDHKI